MYLKLHLKEFWSLLKHTDYNASCPIVGFILQQLQNIALRQGPLPLQIEEKRWIDWCLLGQM